MPFTLPSTFEWLNHRWLLLNRFFGKHSPDHFLNLYPQANLQPVKNIHGGILKCPICGYHMAELLLSDCWSVNTCSAFGLKPIINNLAVFKNLVTATNTHTECTNAALVNNDLSI